MNIQTTNLNQVMGAKLITKYKQLRIPKIGMTGLKGVLKGRGISGFL